MKRYGMHIDIDRCNGCGACMAACAVENNIPPAAPGMDDRKGITPALGLVRLAWHREPDDQ